MVQTIRWRLATKISSLRIQNTEPEATSEPKKRKKSASVSRNYQFVGSERLMSFFKDDPLRQWLIYDRTLFLQELLRLEALESHVNSRDLKCPGCSHDSTENNVAKYRCHDCYGGTLYCCSCTIAQHACNPLHRIEVHFLLFSTVKNVLIDYGSCRLGTATFLNGSL